MPDTLSVWNHSTAFKYVCFWKYAYKLFLLDIIHHDELINSRLAICMCIMNIQCNVMFVDFSLTQLREMYHLSI